MRKLVTLFLIIMIGCTKKSVTVEPTRVPVYLKVAIMQNDSIVDVSSIKVLK